MSRGLVGAAVCFYVAGCGGPGPGAAAPHDGQGTGAATAVAATAVASVTATASARPAEPAVEEVWSKAPIKTAIEKADGCTLTGRHGGLALSVDGDTGVFVERMSGARGEIVIVPGGKSAARVAFGAAFFDTGLSLARTVFYLKERPAPVGGVIRPRQGTAFRVVGGDKAKLAVEMTGYGTEGLEWVTAPKVEVACEGLKGGSWALESPLPATKGKLYPAGSAKVGFRADRSKPVVVRVPVRSAEILETAGDMIKVVSWIDVGVAVGWTEKKEWTETAPSGGSPSKQNGGASGMGSLSPPKVVCPFGTPLYLRRGDQLYEVGELRAPPADAPKEEVDWRVRGGSAELDGAVPRAPATVPWIALRDDFRVTNHFWHDSISGTFVVPKGEKGCK